MNNIISKEEILRRMRNPLWREEDIRRENNILIEEANKKDEVEAKEKGFKTVKEYIDSALDSLKRSK